MSEYELEEMLNDADKPIAELEANMNKLAELLDAGFILGKLPHFAEIEEKAYA